LRRSTRFSFRFFFGGGFLFCLFSHNLNF
jgi:hypothetical protein